MRPKQQSPNEFDPSTPTMTTDRRKNHSGIEQGGRRGTDHGKVIPKNKFLTLAIYGSLIVSLGLIAWAFTMPFVEGTVGNSLSSNKIRNADLADMEYEAKLTVAEYVDYCRARDENLLEQVRNKNKADRPAPSEQARRQKWRDGINEANARFRNMVKRYESEKAEGKVIVKGTVEWEQQRYLQKIVQDLPPDLEL
jgi:hypothetical protein